MTILALTKSLARKLSRDSGFYDFAALTRKSPGSRLKGYDNWTVKTAPGVKGTIKSHSYINNSFLNELYIYKKETKDLSGRLQRTSAKISDFQTTPLPLSGCV